MRTEDFFYELPAELIAQEPVEPRDAARLLDCRDLSDHRFRELPELLEAGDLLVVNRTRVRRARLGLHRADTGGAVELLLLHRSGETWTALARPSRRLRPGVVLAAEGLAARVSTHPADGVVEVELDSEGDLEDTIERVGRVPLPPYFAGELADDERYQTVFATETASAAAPTAGLHFTEELLSELSDAGIAMAKIHLQVGLDTFRPITSDRVDDHTMHSEAVTVGDDVVAAIADTRSKGGRIIAVGTTVVRALETAAAGGEIEPYDGRTDLFIRPGHTFRVVNGLVTNFHVPASTLVVMIAAFVGNRWRDIYATAIERRYRMLSFGDAMLAFR